MNKTKQLGQYYTFYNPFEYSVFKQWFSKIVKKNDILLEPFAGSNNLVNMIKDLGYSNTWKSYDIEPGHPNVIQRDTLSNFPKGFRVCITNPPYLAKNSATRLGLDYPDTEYDDLYKHCIKICLDNCDYLAAIIPESFINSKDLKDRLEIAISLTKPMFEYTDCPVCLALFSKKCQKDFAVYKEDKFLGNYNELNPLKDTTDLNLKFNDPKGALGLWAVDSTNTSTIRFCYGSEITENNIIKVSSRSYTRISSPMFKYINLDKFIIDLNQTVDKFRTNTNDIYLTSFKGLRKDGMYRRRMDWKVAKYIISQTLLCKD